MRFDVIVLGVGVMGAAVLAELAGRGRRVLGLERFDVPHAMGSSHGATRVIRKAYYEHPDYVPWLHDAWARWEALEAARGERLLIRTGALHVGPAGHPDLEAVRHAASTHELAVEALEGRAITARVPIFHPAPGDAALLERDGGVLRAEACVSALAARALASGATIRARTRAVAVEVGAAAVRVRADDGATYEASHLVVALGAWSAHGDAPLPVPVPLTVERQVQLWFSPRDARLATPAAMPVFLRFGAPCVYGLPEVDVPGVKVCLHHGGIPTRADSLDRTITPADVAPVAGFVRAHLPAADGPLLAARVCMYTNTPDGHFVVGPHPDEPARVTLACGFSGHGFKLAPTIGALVADRALDGAPTPALFAPDRFRAA